MNWLRALLAWFSRLFSKTTLELVAPEVVAEEPKGPPVAVVGDLCPARKKGQHVFLRRSQVCCHCYGTKREP